MNNQDTLTIINLTTYELTSMEKQVLQKGLSFSPMATLDKFELIKDTYLFCRQLCFKLLYTQPAIMQEIALEDRGLFQDLLDLAQETDNLTDTWIVTCDVESLYSNIRHKDGIKAVEYFFSKDDTGDKIHQSFLAHVKSVKNSWDN